MVAVAVECPGAALQKRGKNHPHLPVREQSGGDTKFAGQLNIRAQAPQAQHGGHDRGGSEKGAQRECHFFIFPVRQQYATALGKVDSHHYDAYYFISFCDTLWTMKKLKTAVFGTGFMGRVHTEGIRRVGNVEVVAIAASNESFVTVARIQYALMSEKDFVS